MFPSQEEMRCILDLAINQLDDNLRARVREKLISPKTQYRILETLSGEGTSKSWQEIEYPTWLIAIIGERDVGIAYAIDGYGLEGYPWGLVFISDNCSGAVDNWYKSLADCVGESGYFDLP